MELAIIGFKPYIPTTMLGLLGLIAGYLYFYFRDKNNNRIKELIALPKVKRIRMIELMADTLGLPIPKLSGDQQLVALKTVWNARIQKYLITAIALIMGAIIAAFVLHDDKQTTSVSAVSPDISEQTHAKHVADSLQLSEALLHIDYDMLNHLEFTQNDLLKESLSQKDLASLAESDRYGKSIQKKLEELKSNPLILNNSSDLKALVDYDDALYEFDQNNYSVRIGDEVQFPFLNLPLLERKAFFKKLNRLSLSFVVILNRYSTKFPLKKYLYEKLSAAV